MYSCRFQAQAGFTLLELLVSVAVLGVTSATALVAFQEYRVKAMDVGARETLRQVENALQVGMGDYEDDGSATYDFIIIQGKNDAPMSAYGRKLIPGYVNKSDYHLFLQWRPICSSPYPSTCLRYLISVQDCRLKHRSLKAVFHDGSAYSLEGVVGIQCS